MLDIKWVGSPNYTSGRNGRKPIAIVNHITDGLMPGTLSWMQNPIAKASAHYLITRKGQIYQLVKDDDSGWHAGIVNKPNWPQYDGSNPNHYTIGIEHEGYSHQGLDEFQYQATLCLHRHLVKKWEIPLSEDHIIGHYRIDSVNRPNCPGPRFPWSRLFTDLRDGVIEMALEKWMVEDGQAAINELYKKGLLHNPEMWQKEEELGKAVPAYLFWMLLNRVADYGYSKQNRF